MNCYNHFKDQPSSFHKMLEGCPDFHRIIDIDTGKKYSFKMFASILFIFIKWNNDPLNLYEKHIKDGENKKINGI